MYSAVDMATVNNSNNICDVLTCVVIKSQEKLFKSRGVSPHHLRPMYNTQKQHLLKNKYVGYKGNLSTPSTAHVQYTETTLTYEQTSMLDIRETSPPHLQPMYNTQKQHLLKEQTSMLDIRGTRPGQNT